jgi:hypothetical protein
VTKVFVLFLILMASTANAKSSKGKIDVDAVFILKESGAKALNLPYIWVDLSCSRSRCTWIENRAELCLGKEFTPFTSGLRSTIYQNKPSDFVRIDEMEFSEISPGTYEAKMKIFGKANLSYLISLDCSKRFGGRCKVNSVSGSLNVAESDDAYTLTYGLASFAPGKNGNCPK